MPETVDKSIYRHHEDVEAIEARRKSKKKDPEHLARTIASVRQQYGNESDPEIKKAYIQEIHDLGKDLSASATQEDDTERRKRYQQIAVDAESFGVAPKQSRAQELRGMITKRKQRMGAMTEAAENELRFSQAREGKRSLVSPEQRESFEKRLGNRAPKEEAPKEAPKKPTTGEKIAQVAQARAARKQQIRTIKAAQPAPRRNVRLHVKKSKLPKLTKGKNVKLQVPPSKLPHTQSLRSVLHRKVL